MEQENTTPAGEYRAGKHLNFVLDGEHYAVGILSVREIIAMHEITPLPRLPEYVQGVINLRGKIIPVMDLRLRLGLPIHENDRATCIIVLDVTLENGMMTNVGCIVDAVSEVGDINIEDMQDAPSQASGASAEAIHALALQDDGKRVVTILEMEHLLGDLLEGSTMQDAASLAA